MLLPFLLFSLLSFTLSFYYPNHPSFILSVTLSLISSLSLFPFLLTCFHPLIISYISPFLLTLFCSSFSLLLPFHNSLLSLLIYCFHQICLTFRSYLRFIPFHTLPHPLLTLLLFFLSFPLPLKYCFSFSFPRPLWSSDLFSQISLTASPFRPRHFLFILYWNCLPLFPSKSLIFPPFIIRTCPLQLQSQLPIDTLLALLAMRRNYNHVSSTSMSYGRGYLKIGVPSRGRSDIHHRTQK